MATENQKTGTCKYCKGEAVIITDPGLYESTLNGGRCVILQHPTKHYTGCANGANIPGCIVCEVPVGACKRPIRTHGQSSRVAGGGTKVQIWFICDDCYQAAPPELQQLYKVPGEPT